MPSPSDILDNLRRISNDGSAYAVVWHVLLGGMLVPLLDRRRPSALFAAWVVVALFGSVSAFAWRYGNPFNGSVFALLALTCAGLILRSRPGAAQAAAPAWGRALGVLMFAFGWVYPHFVQPQTALAFLYRAPTGLIPCPTLAVALGFELLGWLPRAHAWSWLLAVTGIFYALFGVLRLGVMLDLPLLFGALGLLLVARRAHTARNDTPKLA